MPSGPKKRRAQKKQKESAAALEKTKNEAPPVDTKLASTPPVAIPKEDSPVMQNEGIAGAAVVFDETTVVLPKRTVLLENMLATNVPDFKGKETEEGIRENPLPAEIYSSGQSLTVAESLGRAQKKKEEAAAALKKTNNEAPPIAIPKENSPVMQSESTGGDTFVLAEPTADLPKSVLMLENMFDPDVLDITGNEKEEGIKQNQLHLNMYSSVYKSLTVAQPQETNLADETDVVVESSVVSAHSVLKLDSKEKDGGSSVTVPPGHVDFSEFKDNEVISVTSEPCELNKVSDVCDFEAQETRGTKENLVPNEIFSSVPVLEPQVTSPVVADETDALATDVLELSHNDGGSIAASDDAAFSVLKDNEVISLRTEHCDLDLAAVECLNTANADLIDLDAAEDQRTLTKDQNAVEKSLDLVTANNGVAVENQETAALNELDALAKTEEAFQLVEVEAAAKNQEAEISKDVGIEENIVNELDALAKSEKVVQLAEVEAAAKNQEAEISKDVDIVENILEAVTATESAHDVDALEKPEGDQLVVVEAAANNQEAAISKDVNDIEENVLEAVVAKEPAADIIYQSHDAVSSQVMTPEVGKQLKEIKEMVEDVLNRLIAIDALLHKN